MQVKVKLSGTDNLALPAKIIGGGKIPRSQFASVADSEMLLGLLSFSRK